MGWTEVGQYSKVVKCRLENQYFASYIAIAAVYFDFMCMYVLQSLGHKNGTHTKMDSCKEIHNFCSNL